MRGRPLRLSLSLLGLAALAACGEARREAHGPSTTVIQDAAAESAPGMPALPLKIAPDLTVRTVHFGLLKSDAGSDDQFVPTDNIPAIDGQAFGWIIEVDTTRKTLHWQEHLRMPEPPADWGDAASDPELVISKDGKSVVAQGEDDVEDSELSRFYWSLATGDPAGEYQLDVAVEGHPVAHIRFRVPATVREQSLLVHRTPAGTGVRFIRIDTRPDVRGGARRHTARHGAATPWT